MGAVPPPADHALLLVCELLNPGPRAGCRRTARPVRGAGRGNGAWNEYSGPDNRKGRKHATPLLHHRATSRLYSWFSVPTLTQGEAAAVPTLGYVLTSLRRN